MSYLNMIASLYYTLVLVGGVNWLVTGIRLLSEDNVLECSMKDFNMSMNVTTKSLQVPDALSWADENFQIAIYLLVGMSSCILLVSTLMGYWVREGEPLVVCETA